MSREARGTGSGPDEHSGETEPAALFTEALSILSAKGVAVDGPRAIAMIDAAAAEGNPDAVAMTALFAAMGALRPQSWPTALDRLREAAELGSPSAQAQLRILASGRALAPNEAGESKDWAAMRAGLAAEELLTPPPRIQLSANPRILSFESFATEAECGWIIERARERLKPAKVFSTSSGDQTYNPARDNSAIEFQLSDMDVVVEILRARISAATRLPVPIFEPTQVLHYAVGERFKPHHDFLDINVPGFADHIRRFGQRIATVLVYLNGDYQGGETVFPKIGLSYRGRTGDALFFTNVDRSGHGDPLTMHAGTPPTSGEKWVFSQWIRDRLPPQGG